MKVAFATLRSSSNSVRNVQSRVSNSQSVLLDTEVKLLNERLEAERRSIADKEKHIATLEQTVADLRDDIVWYKAQLTDQRSAPAPTPTPVPPTPAPEAPKAEALPKANVVALKTAKEDKAIKEAEQEVREDIDDGTLEDVMEHFDPMNSAELALLDEEIEANKKAKDAEPAPQSNQTKEESKQPSEEATAKEERRNNITSKPEPAPVKKKRGLFGWLRDNW